jgi:predicted transcriptional regulator
MYTVVVCSNCKHVWIVKDRPERSQCRKCRKTRQFSKLKKYYRDDDLDSAKLARAHAQAKVNDQEERFQDALDRGVLEQEMESAIGEDEYAEKKGMDKEKLDSVVENILDSPSTSLSQREIIKDAIREQEKPSLDEFITYVTERGVDTDQAVLHLEKLVRAGGVSLPPSIGFAEIEAKSEVAIGRPSEPENEKVKSLPVDHGHHREDAESERSSSSSQRNLLLDAVAEHEPDVEAVIDSAVESGVPREKAALGLEKLIRSGEIVRLDLGEVGEAVERTLEPLVEQSPNNSDSEATHEPIHGKDQEEVIEDEETDSKRKERANRSRREIMTDAIAETDEPVAEDVVEYATKHGIGEQKARKYLEKMMETGDVMRSTGGVLRLI